MRIYYSFVWNIFSFITKNIFKCFSIERTAIHIFRAGVVASVQKYDFFPFDVPFSKENVSLQERKWGREKDMLQN